MAAFAAKCFALLLQVELSRASLRGASVPCGKAPEAWEVKAGKKLLICYDETWPVPTHSEFPTCVNVSYGASGLVFEFDVQNDKVQKNAFTADNSDVWNQEVVEVFLSNDTASAKPENYWEVEITPPGAAWLGYDSNPGGDRKNLSHELFDTALVRRQMSSSASGWTAWLGMPWELLGTTPPLPGESIRFRANFFRVQMLPSWSKTGVTKEDMCDPKTCVYTCANCPRTDEPDFHHTACFNTLTLLG